MTESDRILNNVYSHLGLQTSTPQAKYLQISAIVARLEFLNTQNPINGKTTGTISERLCELALLARVPQIYKTIGDKWNWMADFSLLGHPFNLLISVKSFKAKERLLVSGSGNLLSPTVGWGLFNDPDEWTESRTKVYLFRSFIAIYMPSALYAIVPVNSKAINNINGKPFLREIDNFTVDLTAAINNGVIDITAF
ncbi:MAG: hypothetical protein IPP64_11915 [Bacteroidetes bacterium]|nr:hypothetical protein [Bacteroidota bacterium]